MDVFDSMSREEIVIFTAILGTGAGIIVSCTVAILVMWYQIRVRQHQNRIRRQRRNGYQIHRGSQSTPGRASRVSRGRQVLIKNPALLSQEHPGSENLDSVVIPVQSMSNVRVDDTIQG